MNNSLHFSSKTDKWDTHPDLVDDLATVFDWDLDVCASRPNVCETYYDEADDALTREWHGLWWMNPPYGKLAPSFVKYGYEQVQKHGGAGVMLIKSVTDTRMFQTYAPLASQVVFIKGRLKFGSGEAWVARYTDGIKEMDGVALRKLMMKIGGYHLSDYHKSIVHTAVLDIGEFMDWQKSTHLKIDPAPFPSAFLVFGTINSDQRAKLASYGMEL